jgi:hypothetical protein
MNTVTEQRDAHFRELKRAQAIIDGLKAFRESVLTCPADSTPEMRARIRELAYPSRDDFDRAVMALLADYERLVLCANADGDYAREPTHQETIWAEMRPEPWANEAGEHWRPGWHCYADGDKDSEDGIKTLDLAAYTFPPGTKVVVSEPCCPKCGEMREPQFPKVTYADTCECGFDWANWTEEQFS